MNVVGKCRCSSTVWEQLHPHPGAVVQRRAGVPGLKAVVVVHRTGYLSSFALDRH